MKLKPCPFCGRNVETRIVWDDMAVITCECGAIVSFLEKETPETAIAAWNRRKRDDA